MLRASVDTNTLLRLFIEDVPEHTLRVRALIDECAAAGDTLFVPVTVFVEMAFQLHRRRNLPRQEVAQSLLDLARLPVLEVDEQPVVLDALTFWRGHGGISFVDCYHLATTRRMNIPRIYTFDKKMSRYPGVERIEP